MADDETLAMGRLAMAHLQFAGLLAGVFLLALIAYMTALRSWRPDLSRRTAFLLHTLYLLWQSNVAFVAVVALGNGARLAEQAGAVMDGWRLAPYLVPSAACLYAGVLMLSVIIATARRGAD